MNPLQTRRYKHYRQSSADCDKRKAMKLVDRFAWSALVLATVLIPARAAAASCDSLAEMMLPDTTVTVAASVAAGEFTLPGGAATPVALKTLPAFCRVAITLKPSSDSDIK